MPQQVVPDQIAAGWFAVEPSERPGSLQRSGSNSRLNAQAPEFVPRVAGVVPRAVVRVFAAPPPPHRAAFFAAPPPPPPFEFFAPVRVAGRFVAKEPEPELELAAPAAAEPSTADGLADEVAQKITKQVGVTFRVDAFGT
jgi:La-related protein 7